MRTVTVIVPAYNQGAYLGAAIASALAQTHDDLEIVVVDDGSTDDTREVVHGFTDPRVRYVYQDNQGLSAARNTGIRHARGAFLSFLDSDDQFLPDKLALLLAAFDAWPGLGLAAGEAVLIDEHSRPVGEVFDRGLPRESSEWLLGNPLHVGSVLLARAWQERVGLFDETLRSYEDWDMWLRLARAGCPMAWVPQPVSLYRFHREQMTRIGRQMTTATFAVLDKTYRCEDLPRAWLARKNEAYSRAHLRAAAQAYTAGAVEDAAANMAQAVALDPSLATDGGAAVAGIVAGWANHVKTKDPLRFLASVYDHLPEELAPLRSRRGRDLAQEALHLAFAAGERGDAPGARRLAWAAGHYRPRVLLDRRVLGLLVGRARAVEPKTAPTVAPDRGDGAAR